MDTVNTAPLARGILMWSALLCVTPALAQNELYESLISKRAQLDGQVLETIRANQRKAKSLPGSTKLSTRLRWIAESSRQKDFVALTRIAETTGVAVSDNQVGVEMLVTDVNAGQALIRNNGGVSKTVFGNTILAEVPIESLEILSADSTTVFVAHETRLEVAAVSALPTEGVRASRVEALHSAGFLGAGTKVGIIDLEFDGYTELVEGGFIPPAAATRSFSSYEDQFEGGGAHG